MNKASVLIQTLRVPFLILTPVCVFLGFSLALRQGAIINYVSLALALIGALCAHISVNTLNEYLDFKSGLDMLTKRTPFSGGSGALPENPDMHRSVLYIGILSLLITLLIGGYFILQFGVEIVPIGLLGILLIISYTSWINKSPLLCLIAPGLGFGLFVVGTQYVLVGEYYSISWLVALVPFFLVNNLLLLNQYPDIDADKKVGRNHFPIAYGIKLSNLAYLLFLLSAFGSIVVFVLVDYLPRLSLIALLPFPIGMFVWTRMQKSGKDIAQETKYLAMNVMVTLLTPVLLAVSIAYSENP